MGLIRLILAISVVLSHSAPFLGINLIGGQLAVEVFFVISGFYMALILEQKYNKKNSKRLFWENRFLKIFPVYWIILIASVVFEIVNVFITTDAKTIFPLFNPNIHLTLFSLISLIFSNIFIFGLDVFMSLSVNIGAGTFFLNPNPLAFKPFAYTFLFIPQAWSLSSELLFYVVVPFLVELKSKWLLVIIGLSLLLRIYLYKHGFEGNVWSHGAFMTALCEFLSGIIAFRIYKFLKPIKLSKKVLVLIYGFYILYLLVFQYIPFTYFKIGILFGLSILLLPFLFRLSKDNKLDRYLGELSYPIYVCHFLVISFMVRYTIIDKSLWGFFGVMESIMLAVLLVEFVVKPIDKIRQKRLVCQSGQK